MEGSRKLWLAKDMALIHCYASPVCQLVGRQVGMTPSLPQVHRLLEETG